MWLWTEYLDEPYMWGLHVRSTHILSIFTLLTSLFSFSSSSSPRPMVSAVVPPPRACYATAPPSMRERGAALGELLRPLDPVGEREALQACSAPTGESKPPRPCSASAPPPTREREPPRACSASAPPQWTSESHHMHAPPSTSEPEPPWASSAGRSTPTSELHPPAAPPPRARADMGGLRWPRASNSRAGVSSGAAPPPTGNQEPPRTGEGNV